MSISCFYWLFRHPPEGTPCTRSRAVLYPAEVRSPPGAAAGNRRWLKCVLRRSSPCTRKPSSRSDDRYYMLGRSHESVESRLDGEGRKRALEWLEAHDPDLQVHS